MVVDGPYIELRMDGQEGHRLLRVAAELRFDLTLSTFNSQEKWVVAGQTRAKKRKLAH